MASPFVKKFKNDDKENSRPTCPSNVTEGTSPWPLAPIFRMRQPQSAAGGAAQRTQQGEHTLQSKGRANFHQPTFYGDNHNQHNNQNPLPPQPAMSKGEPLFKMGRKTPSVSSSPPSKVYTSPLSPVQSMVQKETKFRHLIGWVDQVIRWNKMAKNHDIDLFFEATGYVESMISKEGQQLIFLKGMSGHILQTVFYTTDRSFSTIPTGKLIIVSGRMIGANKMHIFDIRHGNDKEEQARQRLSFLTQRSLKEALSTEDHLKGNTE